ncbi:group II intron maturase-specific domain-containing protein [Microbulbifer epialgicus]|uniref:Group II intron maturase-specific domain-containing protein n=1 Tax=Microbulbifer epialgicus TaxID=393907 RepID=A0ABV4P6M3_9GAMM
MLLNVISDLRKYLLGWKAYFGITEVLSPLRNIDKWIRRKLWCYIWKQWGRSGYRKLRRLSVDRWTRGIRLSPPMVPSA